MGVKMSVITRCGEEEVTVKNVTEFIWQNSKLICTLLGSVMDDNIDTRAICEEQKEMDRHLKVTYMTHEEVLPPKKGVVDDLTFVYSVVEVDVSYGRAPYILTRAVYEDKSFLCALEGHREPQFLPNEMDFMAEPPADLTMATASSFCNLSMYDGSPLNMSMDGEYSPDAFDASGDMF